MGEDEAYGCQVGPSLWVSASEEDKSPKEQNGAGESAKNALPEGVWYAHFFGLGVNLSQEEDDGSPEDSPDGRFPPSVEQLIGFHAVLFFPFGENHKVFLLESL